MKFKPCYILNGRIAQISLRIVAENYVVKNIGTISVCGKLEIKSRRLGDYREIVSELLPDQEIVVAGKKFEPCPEEFSSRVLTGETEFTSDEAWAYLTICPGVIIYGGSTGFQERDSWTYHVFFVSDLTAEDRFFLRNDPTSTVPARNVKLVVNGRQFYTNPVLTSADWDSVEVVDDSWILRKSLLNRGQQLRFQITYDASSESLPRWTFLSSDTDILNERTQFSLVPSSGVVW